MGNIISNDKYADTAFLKLSNGATEVLISVLLLSGSDLAQTLWEKELGCWLAEHDQSVFGRGVVGFDLDEIAWNREIFAEQKAFFLKMINTALIRHRWEALDYDPPLVAGQLKELRNLVENYRVEFVEPGKTWDWRLKAEFFAKCPLHQVYLHSEGCAICNDR
jgi:hypothetical protein